MESSLMLITIYRGSRSLCSTPFCIHWLPIVPAIRLRHTEGQLSVFTKYNVSIKQTRNQQWWLHRRLQLSPTGGATKVLCFILNLVFLFWCICDIIVDDPILHILTWYQSIWFSTKSQIAIWFFHTRTGFFWD